ncbi:Invasion protein B family protein [Cupriavidus sp. YR651]|uniref:InvB/SpaK family type III secretion system chaperone n=1 Tax=Cupriavidus sp. YR651 TaxID=1855315 RepID=UPI00087EBDD4|nr:hypothetical protein [Cupriavidus sp. YR651]SDD38743.1 Invasion protein B family protein [Cupriavidus sp. YR651]
MNECHIGDMVKQALMAAGCDSVMVESLDEDVTVQIDFENTPSILVGQNNGLPVIWSDICEFHQNLVALRGARLLEEVMKCADFSANGQLVLREQDGQLQVFADIADAYSREPEMLARAIDGFYERVATLSEIVKQ